MKNFLKNRKFFALTAVCVVLFAGFQAGCGGGSQFAEEVSESPESSMDSVYESSDAGDLFGSESDLMDSESGLLADSDGMDLGSEGADFDLYGDSDVIELSDDPDQDMELLSIGEEPQAGGEVLAVSQGEIGTMSSADSVEPGKSMSAGSSTDFVSPGGTGPLGALSPDGVASYTVESGDSLWRISEKPSIYSDPWEWPLIYHANEEQISNPDLIHVGWNLDIPRGVEENVILAAIQEARAAKYVPPSRASQTEDFGTADDGLADLAGDQVLVADANSAQKVLSQAPIKVSKPAPIKARSSGGGLSWLLWFVVFASTGGFGYFYYKRVKDRKGINAGTATFSF